MKVIYAPEADDDIFGIVEFIARDKPDVDRNWMRKIRETCDASQRSPIWVKNGVDSVFPDAVHSASVAT
ncbi:MAG: hypothetical protein ACF8CQ_24165 [Rhodopirellula sp. JB044]|uniref:hypothetical protein n=1 Tax=Rhodopirellula sp. JB044 TaxID=3342844 RepID=UPI00370BF5C5